MGLLLLSQPLLGGKGSECTLLLFHTPPRFCLLGELKAESVALSTCTIKGLQSWEPADQMEKNANNSLPSQCFANWAPAFEVS